MIRATRPSYETDRPDNPHQGVPSNYRTTFQSSTTTPATSSYGLHTPSVSFEPPAEKERAKRYQQTIASPQELSSIILGQFMPDLDPYT